MNYDAFVAKWNGKQVTAYLGQCVALVSQYCVENGKPIAWADAKDWWLNPALIGSFNFINNDPKDYNQVPKKGDVMIWSGALAGSGGSGHVSIFDHIPSPGIFISFDQNWGGRQAHFVTHTFNDSSILGWMTPKTGSPVAPPTNQGGNMPTLTTKSDLDFLYTTSLGRSRSPGEGEDVYLNKDYKFVNTDLYNSKEAVARRAGAAKQLADMQASINQLNQTVTDIAMADKVTKQQLQEALAKVAATTSDLEKAHDTIKDLQDRPLTGEPSWLGKVRDFLNNFLKKG